MGGWLHEISLVVEKRPLQAATSGMHVQGIRSGLGGRDRRRRL
jgi:hypothetical protein